MAKKTDSICARCASGERGSRDCCTEPFLFGSQGFALTISDVGRIMRRTRLEPEEFCSIKPVNMEEYNAEPESYFTPLVLDGKWLGMNGQGKCFFLGEGGCTIFEDRPRMCKIFPFWFEMSGKDIRPIFERCEAEVRLCALENSCPQDILKSLKDNEEALILNVKLFLEEIEQHKSLKETILNKGVKAAVEKNEKG